MLKVKEPIAEEYHRMRPGLTLFTYLHLAADKACTDALLDNKVTGIAYETVQLSDGSLPLLAPMSEVAGRLGPQVGAYHLMRSGGGYGALLGGVPGTYAANVVVIGGGVSGQNAAQIAVGMGAHVTVLDRNIARLRQIDEIYQGRIQTVASNAYEIEKAVLEADLVIGAVLVTGAKAPKLVSNELVSRMKPGSVLVDIAIDQGGCFEDSHPTTHADPVFKVHNSIFYCVANMPGAVPEHLHLRADQRDPALRGRARQQRLARRPQGRQGPGRRPQHARGRADQRPRRAGPRLRVGDRRLGARLNRSRPAKNSYRTDACFAPPANSPVAAGPQRSHASPMSVTPTTALTGRLLQGRRSRTGRDSPPLSLSGPRYFPRVAPAPATSPLRPRPRPLPFASAPPRPPHRSDNSKKTGADDGSPN